MIDLEEQESIFLNQATQVNAWDRLLIDNGEKICELHNEVEKVKADQQRLDHELDFILSQQRELEDIIGSLEKTTTEASAAASAAGITQHSDLEREHTYTMAENIDAQLKRMVSDLREIIDHLNANNSMAAGDGSRPDGGGEPTHQIAKILNAHIDSLNWVDQNTALLHRKVEEISRLHDSRRKEQERTFRLAYD